MFQREVFQHIKKGVKEIESSGHAQVNYMYKNMLNQYGNQFLIFTYTFFIKIFNIIDITKKHETLSLTDK